MTTLRANMLVFALLLAAPAVILAWLGFRGLAPLEREVERTTREELVRAAGAFAAALPARVDAWLAARERELQRLAARIADELPLAGAEALARLEAEADAALCVRAANGRAVLPAGPADLELTSLPEWRRFAAMRADDAAAWRTLESPPLLARGVALAFADHPAAGVPHLPPLDGASLAAAGPLVVEWLLRSEAGRAWLAPRAAHLLAVPATEGARLAWLEALAVPPAALARQRLRAARERGTAPAPLREALPAGATIERLPDPDAACAALAASTGDCTFTCALSPTTAPHDGLQLVQPTALGALTIVGTHAALPGLRAGSERRRLLTGVGVASLLAVVAAGLLLVRRALLHEAGARALRDQFLANVSHDLKTPLTSLRLHAEMLTDPALDAATRARYAAVVEAEGARMSALVEDLVDMAALQQGRRRLEPEPVDLAAAARTFAAAWQPLAAREGIALRCSVDGEATALADPVALGRILTNLMQNALRHGRPPRDGGPPWIALQAGPGPRLCVRDNGPGVPPALRERIFGRFVRARADGDGLGLGLALSRELAVACGGTLQCDDDGTTVFVLQLPDAPATGEP